MGRAGRSRLAVLAAVVAALGLAALLFLGNAGLGRFGSGGSGPASAPAAGAPDAPGGGSSAEASGAPRGATLAATAAADPPPTRRRILGRVVDREGKPVARARVAAGDAIAENGPRVSDTDDALPATGPDGRFDIPAPAPAVSFRVLAVADSRGYAFARGVRLDDPADLVLIEGATLVGRVVGPRGEPIAGARATIVGTVAGAAIESGAVSDRDGRFEARGLPREIDVRVDAPERFSVARRVQFEGVAAREETFVLGRGATLRGLVTDAKAKTPVVGATVYAVVCPESDEEALRPGRQRLAAGTTDEKGRVVLERLPTALATENECLSIVVEAARYAPEVTRCEMPSEGGVRALTVVLEKRSCMLDVLVEDEGGVPVAGAFVVAGDSRNARGWGQALETAESRGGVKVVDVGRTGADGRLRMGPFAPPGLSIVASHGGRRAEGSARFTDGPPAVTVRFKETRAPLRTIEGDVVSVDWTPIPGASVQVWAEGMECPVLTRSDDSGRFSLIARIGSDSDATLNAWHPGFVTGRVRLTDLASGARVRIVLAAGVTVSGRVLGADGRPWPSARLAWQPTSAPDEVVGWGELVADSEGRFRIEDAPSQVTLVAGLDCAEPVVLRDVPGDRPIEVRLAESWKAPEPEAQEPPPPPTARDLVVSVLRPEGNAPVTSRVTAWILPPGASRWTEGKVTGYGHARFEKVPFGAYRLWVSGTGFPTLDTTVEVPFGAEPLAVPLTVSRGATVVVLVDADEPVDARDVIMALGPKGGTTADWGGFDDSRRERDRVEFHGVAPGAYWLEASVLGRPEWIVAAPSEVVVRDDREVRTSIRLVRGGEVRFVFVETGVPGGKKDGRSWWTWPARVAILTDASGREWWFRATVDGKALWEEDAPRDRRLEREAATDHLPPGEYRAHVDGLDPSTDRAFTVRAGETTRVVLEVPPTR